MSKAVRGVAPQPKEDNVQKSFLEEFTLVPAVRKTGSKGGGLATARTRVLDGVKAQKANIVKELAGEKLTGTSFKKKDGKTVERAATTWYYEREGGAFTEVRYGQKSVFTEGDKPQAFPAGKTLKDLPAFYDKLIAAIERGELDAPIEKVQKATSASLTGKSGKK